MKSNRVDNEHYLKIHEDTNHLILRKTIDYHTLHHHLHLHSMKFSNFKAQSISNSYNQISKLYNVYHQLILMCKHIGQGNYKAYFKDKNPLDS